MKTAIFRQAPPITSCQIPSWPEGFIDVQCSRLAARYRVARAFKRVELDSEIEKGTALAYSALIRFATVYSAWECFERTFGFRDPKKQSMAESEVDTKAVEAVLHIRTDYFVRLCGFLRDATSHKSSKDDLDQMARDRQCRVCAFAGHFRNAYAHGHLTANSGQMGKDNIRAVADALSDYLLKVIERYAAEYAKARQEGLRRKGVLRE